MRASVLCGSVRIVFFLACKDDIVGQHLLPKLNNTLIKVCGFRKDIINDNPALHFTFTNTLASIIMIESLLQLVATELF